MYWRRASTATSTPGSSNPASEMSRAVCSSTSPAIRTRSKVEPGLPSIVALISAGVDARAARPGARRRPAALRRAGRSAGRTLTANVGTFVTSSAAVAVVDQAARRRDRLEDGPVARRRASRTGRRRRSGGRRAAPSARRRRATTIRPKTRNRDRLPDRPRAIVEVRRSPVDPLDVGPAVVDRDRQRPDEGGEDGVVDGARAGSAASGSATGIGARRALKATNRIIE